MKIQFQNISCCEWLKAELYQHKNRDGYPNVESRSYTSVRDLIDDFKQAIEYVFK